MQVKSFLWAAGLGAAAGLAVSIAMPRQMQQVQDAMGTALHKAERYVCSDHCGC